MAKKLKQWSDEAFNAGKETEAMKRLTLHRIASSLLVPSFGWDRAVEYMELTEETAEVQILLVYKYVILGIASASARSANLRAQEHVSIILCGILPFLWSSAEARVHPNEKSSFPHRTPTYQQ